MALRALFLTLFAACVAPPPPDRPPPPPDVAPLAAPEPPPAPPPPPEPPALQAAPAPPEAPPAPKFLRAFYIGHSLQSDIPDIVRSLAGESKFAFREQFIPGAPLRWQWGEAERKNAGMEPSFQQRYDLAAQDNYQVLVLVDSVPRGGPEMLAETVEYAAKFIEAFRAKNPQIQTYLYEPWHHITSGTPQVDPDDNFSPTRKLRWRPRLDADRKFWDDAVTQLKQKGYNVRLIPGGRALGALADAIEAGQVPGFKTTRDLFDDDIHLNAYGKLFVGLLHYAVLYNQSPVGLSQEVQDRWARSYWNHPNWQNKTYAPPNPEAVRFMQQLAWKIASGG